MQSLPVSIRHRYSHLAEYDPSSLDIRHLRRLDDIRTVHPYESVRRKLLFQNLHAHQRQNRLRTSLKPYPYKVQLVLQRYLLTAAAIKHIPQQPAQVMDSTLGPCGIELYEGIDIVQSIEQEMRIELLPQILQFGL